MKYRKWSTANAPKQSQKEPQNLLEGKKKMKSRHNNSNNNNPKNAKPPKSMHSLDRNKSPGLSQHLRSCIPIRKRHIRNRLAQKSTKRLPTLLNSVMKQIVLRHKTVHQSIMFPVNLPAIELEILVVVLTHMDRYLPWQLE